MSAAADVVERAASIQLDLDEDVLSFSYVNDRGEDWEGCVEEWIGNSEIQIAAEHLVVEMNGQKFYQIGTSGGGADIILIRDDEEAAIYYLNDYDHTVSRVGTLDEFVKALRSE